MSGQILSGSSSASTTSSNRSCPRCPRLRRQLPVRPAVFHEFCSKLRCIGATTFEEYRLQFDRDRALARRFQTIEVDEPSLQDTMNILRGLLPHYENCLLYTSP